MNRFVLNISALVETEDEKDVIARSVQKYFDIDFENYSSVHDLRITLIDVTDVEPV